MTRPISNRWVCPEGGHVQRDGYVQGGGDLSPSPDMEPEIPQDTVSKRVLRILMVCFLVYLLIAQAGEINIKRLCVLSGWQLARLIP